MFSACYASLFELYLDHQIILTMHTRYAFVLAAIAALGVAIAVPNANAESVLEHHNNQLSSLRSIVPLDDSFPSAAGADEPQLTKRDARAQVSKGKSTRTVAVPSVPTATLLIRGEKSTAQRLRALKGKGTKRGNHLDLEIRQSGVSSLLPYIDLMSD